MQEDSPLTHSVTTSRRGLLALAAGGALVTAIGAPRAFAQAGAVNLPKASDAVEPFSVSVPRSAIDDLKRRLAFTRLPERETVGDWSQGVPLEKARTLIAYWRDRYDWRRFEARINALPQYRTRIDGLGIHFIHVRSPHPNALPIILTHGWPGSFVEFMEIMRLSGLSVIPRALAGERKTHSMSSCRRSRASGFPISRPRQVGT